MNFQAYRYFPSFFLRNAELRALEELPEHEKDLILPTFFLRPWATSRTLEQAIDRIEKAFGNRKFILDLDRFYVARHMERPAVSDYIRLREPQNFQEWLAFVELFPKAIPAIRTVGLSQEQLRRQIETASVSERGFAVRLDREAGVNVGQIANISEEIEHANFVFSVDPGWSNDLLNHTTWASSAVASLGRVKPEAPVIVSGSSFPDTFEYAEPIGQRQLKERTLFSDVSRLNNNVTCLYGDWASVRPPAEESVPMTPVPRIDLSQRQAWTSFRYRTAQGGYRKAAEEAMGSRHWDDSLHVWGTYLIRATAYGDAEEITYAGLATAARVNMHLHVQANFDDPLGYIDTEDEFTD